MSEVVSFGKSFVHATIEGKDVKWVEDHVNGAKGCECEPHAWCARST